jgi:hypothetical protein
MLGSRSSLPSFPSVQGLFAPGDLTGQPVSFGDKLVHIVALILEQKETKETKKSGNASAVFNSAPGARVAGRCRDDPVFV